ncbi:hypothetical protein ACJRO7_035551 [Eucalyptus globulus]|uniref:Uncharacterized protein n=1 Tax=Eucalyptus globulus TaxID=34317 RepID=A0ABD3JD84_EUCGL
MKFNNVAMTRFFLAWCLLVTTATALTGHHGVRATLEAGNSTNPQGCRGGECLIAYQQTEVELMAALDPEHDALASMLASVAAGKAVSGAKKPNKAGCGRSSSGQRYTPCTPQKNLHPPRDPYNRARP